MSTEQWLWMMDWCHGRWVSPADAHWWLMANIAWLEK